MRRAGLLLVAGAAGLLLTPAAHAGSYDVVACDAAYDGTNQSWIPAGASAHYEVDSLCPTVGNADAGLRVRDRIGSANAPSNSSAQWRFSAPSDTRITGWRYRRWLGKDGTNSWDVHARLGDGTTLDSCTIPYGLPNCEVGAPAGSNAANERVASGLSATSLEFGIRCAAASGYTCATGGATIHNAWAHLYASTVTLSESGAPTVEPPAGPLTEGGWRRGAQSVTVGGHDPVGIRHTRVYVDGTLADAATRACDFTYSLPCVDPPCTPAIGQTCGSGATSATHVIATTALADGRRQVRVAVVDAAGNETRSASVAVDVDNNAPSFALSAPAGETADRALAVSWSSGDGTGSGVAGHDIEVSIDGGAWQRWLAATPRNSADYPAEQGRRYRFRGRSSDASGLTSGWVETAEIRVVAEPATCACPPADAGPSPAPQPATDAPVPPASDPPQSDPGSAPTGAARRTPALRIANVDRRGARLAVRGRVSPGATGRVTITYSARVGGRTVRTRRSVRARRGRFSTTLRLGRHLASGRARMLSVAYSGDDAFRPRTVHTRRVS